MLTKSQNENKYKFLELYKKAQNDEIDLYSLDEKTLKMIYKLMQEEIMIVDKAIIEKKEKLRNLKKD